MKVLVTGATGFIGKKLCETLTSRGDEVVALSRDADKAMQSLPMVKSAMTWNPVHEPAPKDAFAGVTAVVNLIGETIGQKWNDAVKRKIRDSRVIGTRNLVETIRQLDSKPRVLVSGSAIGFYGNRGDEELTEDSPPGNDFLADLGKEWEAEALHARDVGRASSPDSGVRVVLLRTGVVLEKDGGALKQMLTPFKLGMGGPMGDGKQWFAWIHRDDLVGLILHAIDNEQVSGPLNGTAPNPVTNKEFAQTLGKVLRRPAFLPTPVFAMRLRFGEFTDAALLSSQRVIPKKALDTGYKFKFPQLEDALRAIIK